MAHKTDEEINLLRRALKVAAIEAYQNEVVDTEMVEHTIGNYKEYLTTKDWLDDRIESWLQEAELKT